MSEPTAKQLVAAIDVAATVFQVIAAHGASGIPSGHLYAATMAAFSDLGAYEACLGLLVKSGLVKREGLMLFAARAEAAGADEASGEWPHRGRYRE
jgi:hypothetical protein